jgi:hypothetical protein
MFPSRSVEISRDIAVGIVTGYGLDDRGDGVRVPVGSKIFSSPYLLNRLWSPPSLLCNEFLGLSGRTADHSPPVSAEVEETCVSTSTPPCVFMA